MQMNMITSSQLYTSRLNQTIRLRVPRVWDCIIPSSGKCLGMAFVATNHSGNGIHVQIAERDMRIFKQLLMEGTLYDITGFRIGATTVRYIASPSENHLPYLANKDKFLAVAAIHLPGGTISRKRDFYIMTLYNRRLKITIWESSYNTLDVEELIGSEEKPVVIFAGMIVKTFNGGHFLLLALLPRYMSTLTFKKYQGMEGPV
ncbi:Nucleic acid-binding protein [Corchorus olitorius]|uniref:Nucleic acid-binding protein n=1 Tax=Corchorus olitorius TaxID=93759 RepID=A0A1R3IWK3_9ROSI|nr:Nucleic acid-binding protein [Corchorus olitorius]